MGLETPKRGSVLAEGFSFLGRHRWLVVVVSALLVVPCLWHRHIEAGDLGSHVYNAWLGQLIGKGQAPGLYLAHPWNNVFFDVSLLRVANRVGFAAAEEIVVSACVLIFFWGVFAFVAAVTGRVPWFLAPGIAMLAYGYSFNMGFMNYYLSIGLACFCLAFVWRGWAGNWLPLLVVGVLLVLAHPLGLVWFASTVLYVSIRRSLPGWWKALLPLGVIGALIGFRWYLHMRPDLGVDWGQIPFYFLNGIDQLALYGERYTTLAWVAFAFGCVVFLFEVAGRWREASFWKSLALPLELYFVAFCATALLPENLRVSLYAAWIGLLVSRLTTISAILGFCVLACVRPQNWHLAGFSALAALFFSFLYQDTATLNRMETNAEKILSGLPPGTRIIPTIYADPEWRVEFIVHLADRACVGRCFVYSNYEPSSRQFRVRAEKGSPIVTDSSDDAEDMQGGAYEIQDTDPPLKQLFQCDPGDRTRLCLRDLAEGDNTGAVGLRPPN